jgi:hypothetical protein
MVDALIVHMRAEFDHDLSAAMATMTLDGYSRHWGGGPVLGRCHGKSQTVSEEISTRRWWV